MYKSFYVAHRIVCKAMYTGYEIVELDPLVSDTVLTTTTMPQPIPQTTPGEELSRNESIEMGAFGI